MIGPLPDWAAWTVTRAYSIGLEEEVMILDPADWSLSGEVESLLRSLPPDFARHVSAETHYAAIELATAPHESVEEAGREAAALRRTLLVHLHDRGLAAAAAGTHPFAVWRETQVSAGARYQLVYESMRELARREPTFALHVHVGVLDPEAAILLANRLRAHLPLLLALSASSPFWQGRDTGLSSARTPIFQAFPRVGIPRAFDSYGQYVDVVERLLRSDAFPEPTFLWWEVRLQPRFGTVEVRVMDSQHSSWRSTALASLIQAIAHLELEEGYLDSELAHAPEILEENRFLAFRDGIDARFIDADSGRRVPAREQLARLLVRTREHAQELGSEQAVEAALDVAGQPAGAWQRQVAEASDLRGLVSELAARFDPR